MVQRAVGDGVVVRPNRNYFGDGLLQPIGVVEGFTSGWLRDLSQRHCSQIEPDPVHINRIERHAAQTQNICDSLWIFDNPVLIREGIAVWSLRNVWGRPFG